NQRFGNWFDWGAYDNRNWFDYAVFDSRSVDPEGFLAVGFFNSSWQFDPATSWEGDRRVRERVVPRHTPIYFEPPTDRPSLRLSDLMPVFIDQQKGTVELDRSFRANPLRIGERQFSRGLGVRAPSRVVYDLGGGWSRFHATVGLDGEGEPVSPDRREAEWVEFRILGDGRVLAKSPEVSWESPFHTFDVNVKGVHRLELITKPMDWRLWLFGSAGWGDVEVTR
ncbi:MAG: NPCBM/NEW2 domain-containing protein, partial [Armatimonadetes bacterium]|nr:NPCBM/NEW2 domain-containing protein [Armatimonadota bacterium]